MRETPASTLDVGALDGMRPAPLPLHGASVAPAYGGRSVMNLHGSLLRAFSLPGGPPPIDPALVGDAFERAERVVVVLLDALGAVTLDALLESEPFPLLRELTAAGGLRRLTSVFPSSTNVVLRSISTGLTPAAHGVPGANIVLDGGLIANMLRFRASPQGFGAEGVPMPLDDLGIEAERFKLPTLYDRLTAGGVPSTVIVPHRIIDSPLSRLNHAGATRHLPFLSPSDMALALRGALAALGDGPGLIYAYWDAIDTLQHLNGAGGEVVALELAAVLGAIERGLAGLPPASRRGTLFVLTADHGQTTIDEGGSVLLSEHPELVALLAGRPAGNTRAAYLRAGEGRLGELRAALAEVLPDTFDVVDTHDLVRSGVLGPEAPEREGTLAARIGDLVVFAGPHQQLLDEPTAVPIPGRHAALSPEEMLVPLVTADLGDL